MSSEYPQTQLPDEEKPFRFGRFSFDPVSNILLDGETIVSLPPKTCELLGVFLRNRGKLLSKTELMDMVWHDTFVEESNLTHHIAALRKALGNIDLIQTVPRKGYRFSAEALRTDPVIVQRTERRVVEVEDFIDDAKRGPVRLRAVWVALGLSLIGVLFAGAAYWVGFGTPQVSATSTTLALSVAGNVRSFAVSPDGRMIAFSWRQEGEKSSQVYVQLAGGGNPLKLTNSTGSSVFPAWSPDGSTIAFIRSEGDKAFVHLVPALGGQERKLCDLTDPAALDLVWSPDGNYLAVSDIAEQGSKARAIILISASDGTRRQLTEPLAEAYGDFVPAFSPDSRSIAFRRDTAVASDVYRVEISTRETMIVGRESVLIQGLIWPTANKIVYAAKRGSVAELFSLSSSDEQTPKKLLNLSTQASRISFARIGGNFYFLQNLNDTNVWETALDPSMENVLERKKLIASPRIDENAVLSPDGQKIAFISDRSGFSEIWLANSDGGEQSKLTDLSGPVIGALEWSPDGTLIAVQSSYGEHQDIYIVNAASGKSERLTEGGKHFVRGWSKDGTWVYFASSIGKSWQFSKRSVKDRTTVVIDADGGNAGFETKDGSVILCKMDAGGIWRKRPDGSHEQIVGETEYAGVAKASLIWPVNDGLIYFSKDEADVPGYTYFDLRNSARRRILDGVSQERIGLSISNDGRRWFANRNDYSSAEVVRVDGLVF